MVEMTAAATLNAFVALCGYFCAAFLIDRVGRLHYNNTAFSLPVFSLSDAASFYDKLPTKWLVWMYLGSSLLWSVRTKRHYFFDSGGNLSHRNENHVSRHCRCQRQGRRPLGCRSVFTCHNHDQSVSVERVCILYSRLYYLLHDTGNVHTKSLRDGSPMAHDIRGSKSGLRWRSHHAQVSFILRATKAGTALLIVKKSMLSVR